MFYHIDHLTYSYSNNEAMKCSRNYYSACMHKVVASDILLRTLTRFHQFLLLPRDYYI
jgi:hypothetical protein